MIAHITESLLVISPSRPSWLDESITGAYRVAIQPSTDSVTHPLDVYDLILIVATDDSYDAIWQAESIRQRHPDSMIWLVADSVSIEDYRRLTAARVDDILSGDITPDDLLDRLKQSFLTADNQDDAFSADSFDQLASTLDLLHQYAPEPDFTYHALDTISRTYNLYGCILLLKTNGKFTVYSLRRDLTRSHFHVDKMIIRASDIAYNVLRDRQPQLVDPVTSLPTYVEKSLPNTRTMLMLPLIYRSRSNGLLLICNEKASEFSSSDVHIFKSLASHLAIALYSTQSVDAGNHNTTFKEDDQKIIISAWERLASQRSSEHIANTLQDIASTLTCIQSALVWLPAADQKNPIISTLDSKLKQAFIQYNTVDGFVSVWRQFNTVLAPVQIKRGETTLPEASELFQKFGGDHLVCLPIVDTARVDGMLIVSIQPGCDIQTKDLTLLEDLTRTTGQALERMSLIDAMHEKSSRLEHLLESISEGAFFINENNIVTFCNPQFTDVTHIRREDTINQEARSLFTLMTRDLPGDDTTRARLMAVLDDAQAQTEVIRLDINRPSGTYQLELTPLQNKHETHEMWAGIVRSDGTPTDNVSLPEETIDYLLESFTEINDALASVARTTHQRDAIYKIQQHVVRVGLHLGYTRQLANITQKTPVYQRQQIKANNLIEQVMVAHRANNTVHPLKLTAEDNLPQVFVDAQPTVRAIANLLYIIGENAAGDSATSVNLAADHSGALIMSIHNPSLALQADRYNITNKQRIALHTNDLTEMIIHGSFQVVRQQGGTATVRASSNGGTTLSLTLPRHISEPTKTHHVVEFKSIKPPETPQLRLPLIALLRGKSTLAAQVPDLLKEHYSVRSFRTVDALLEKIENTAFAMIMIDSIVEGVDTDAIAESLYERTDRPIIMLSDDLQRRTRQIAPEISAHLSGEYDTKNLLDRIKTVLVDQTDQESFQQPFRVGDLYIDVNRREVILDNEPLALTRIEYDLLYILATNAGKVLRHEDLLTKVWGSEYRNAKQYLWVNMSRLRKKVHASSKKSYIHTRSGVGYFLQVIA